MRQHSPRRRLRGNSWTSSRLGGCNPHRGRNAGTLCAWSHPPYEGWRPPLPFAGAADSAKIVSSSRSACRKARHLSPARAREAPHLLVVQFLRAYVSLPMESPYLATKEAAVYLRFESASAIRTLVMRGELAPAGAGPRGTHMFVHCSSTRYRYAVPVELWPQVSASAS
jgi:hypothetical protein